MKKMMEKKSVVLILGIIAFVCLLASGYLMVVGWGEGNRHLAMFGALCVIFFIYVIIEKAIKYRHL